MLNNKTILIVEDDEPLRKILAAELKECSYNIIQAKNGEEGLNLALAKRPDLILLDLLMPKKDGITMLRQLRESIWGKTAKVIILTNLSEAETMSEIVKEGLIESGVEDYLVKSNWKIEEIINAIKEKIQSE